MAKGDTGLLPTADEHNATRRAAKERQRRGRSGNNGAKRQAKPPLSAYQERSISLLRRHGEVAHELLPEQGFTPSELSFASEVMDVIAAGDMRLIGAGRETAQTAIDIAMDNRGEYDVPGWLLSRIRGIVVRAFRETIRQQRQESKPSVVYTVSAA